MPGQRRLVERDQRVAERDEQQQLGELEHVIAKAVAREHHMDAVPGDDDRGEREEQAVSEAQELWLVRQQQARDCLLDRRKQIELHEACSAPSSYGCRQVLSASPEPATNASSAAAPIAPRDELHVHARSLGIASPLAVDQELFDACRRAAECVPAAAERRSEPAPLILSRTAVVLCSREGSVTSRSRASIAGSSVLPAVERSWPVPWVAAMAAASARSRVASCLNRGVGPPVEPIEQPGASASGLAQFAERPTRRIAEDQRVVVVLRDRRSRPRCVRHRGTSAQRVLPQVREHAQAPRHPRSFAVLLALHVWSRYSFSAAVTVFREVVAAS